MAIETNSVQI